MPTSARRHSSRTNARRETFSRRTEYRSWYNTQAWRRLRAFIIQRDKALCQHCLRNGKLTPVLLHASQGSPQTAHVDHLKDHHGDWDLFRDPQNLETKCASCHSKKTIQSLHAADIAAHHMASRHQSAPPWGGSNLSTLAR